MEEIKKTNEKANEVVNIESNGKRRAFKKGDRFTTLKGQSLEIVDYRPRWKNTKDGGKAANGIEYLCRVDGKDSWHACDIICRWIFKERVGKGVIINDAANITNAYVNYLCDLAKIRNNARAKLAALSDKYKINTPALQVRELTMPKAFNNIWLERLAAKEAAKAAAKEEAAKAAKEAKAAKALGALDTDTVLRAAAAALGIDVEALKALKGIK